MAKKYSTLFKTNPTDLQKGVINFLRGNQISIIQGEAGCLGKGTKVIMFDGSLKAVEDIIEGDLLMGDDSTPRKVLKLCRGVEQMYIVNQNRGISYRVNENHILSLSKTESAKFSRKNINGKRIYEYDSSPLRDKTEKIVDVNLSDYLKSKVLQKKCNGFIPERIDFKEKELEIDPYYFGLWIGDGYTRNPKNITNIDKEIIDYLLTIDPNLKRVGDKGKQIILSESATHLNESFKKLFNISSILHLKDKYIPFKYLTSSYEQRMQLLAGIIDSDGHYNNKEYSIVQKSEVLINAINYLCRSLGFKSVVKEKTAKMRRLDGSIYTCPVFVLRFSPYKEIPTKVNRKTYKNDRLSPKNPRNSCIKIVKDTVDNYYGFILDGNHRFLLEDFTVTHNTGKDYCCLFYALSEVLNKGKEKIVFTKPTVEVGRSLGFLPGTDKEKTAPYEESIYSVVEDIVGAETLRSLINANKLEFLNVGFCRGNTVKDAIIIATESQNFTLHELVTLTTRISESSKLLLNGDILQSDIKNSGFSKYIELYKNVEDIGYMELGEEYQMRHPLIVLINRIYRNYLNETTNRHKEL